MVSSNGAKLQKPLGLRVALGFLVLVVVAWLIALAVSSPNKRDVVDHNQSSSGGVR